MAHNTENNWLYPTIDYFLQFNFLMLKDIPLGVAPFLTPSLQLRSERLLDLFMHCHFNVWFCLRECPLHHCRSSCPPEIWALFWPRQRTHSQILLFWEFRIGKEEVAVILPTLISTTHPKILKKSIYNARSDKLTDQWFSLLHIIKRSYCFWHHL